ncbi:MAG: YncE family protein [bacterium]
MIYKKLYVTIAVIFTIIFLYKNAFPEEILQAIRSYELPVPTISLISFNPYKIDQKEKSIWTVRNANQIVKINLDLDKITQYVPFPGVFCEDICWEDSTSLWVSDSLKKQLLLISIPGGKTIKSIPSPGNGPAGVAIYGGYLWNSDSEANKLYQLNKLDGKVIRDFDIPCCAEGMVAADDALFFIADSKIQKFDLKNKLIIKTYLLPFSDAMGIAWDGDCFYIDRHHTNTIDLFTLH